MLVTTVTVNGVSVGYRRWHSCVVVPIAHLGLSGVSAVCQSPAPIAVRARATATRRLRRYFGALFMIRALP
jgi:hypothetical protein